MVERHGSAMSWKSAMGEKCFHSNVEEKFPHGGHYGGAPWERHIMEERHGRKMFPFYH